MYNDIDIVLYKLSKSKFRSSFHLNKKMKEYVNTKGIETIKKHTYDFITKRLKHYDSKKDGKQTPMKQTHPVFIAQHACACCCRSCIEKWYKIDKHKTLNEEEMNYILNIIIKWIKNEIKEGE